MDSDRGKGRGRRHAGEKGARASGVAFRILARLRRRRARALQARSEPEVHREQVIESAEIDLRSREALARGQVPAARLIPDLSAEIHAADWEACAAEDHRSDGAAAAGESVAEDK